MGRGMGRDLRGKLMNRQHSAVTGRRRSSLRHLTAALTTAIVPPAPTARSLMKRILPLVLLRVVAAPACADDKKSFFFKKGDRVLFLGDSITEQYQYSNTIELYLTTRFPDWELFFLNAGISGDTA